MKKIVSILLAVMMIAAIAVPSFAATITKESDPKTADVQVKTKTTDKENNDPENYTVTIPAEITVAWNDTAAQDASYTVDSQLKLGAKLKVSAVAENAGKMTNAATDKFLTFTVAGGDVAEYSELNNAVKFIKHGDKVKVSIRFRGREMGHPEIGLETMNRFAEACAEFASVEKPAKLEGRNMLMFLAPKSNK